MPCHALHPAPCTALQESPAWPVLVESCASRGIKLGLLNARMSSRAFLSWFQRRVSRALLHRMLANFSLIVPQSDIVSGQCCLLVTPAAQSSATVSKAHRGPGSGRGLAAGVRAHPAG